ncbi:MAG: heme-binding protein [Kiritimatiellales bacterium]
MKRATRIILATTVLIIGTIKAMATEETAYRVVEKEDPFELRDYAPCIRAEILVEGTLEEAGSKAFRPLFRYISGENQTHGKVAMTAPVAQQPAQDRWAVSFMMPAAYTLEKLPEPENPAITLRQVPARRVAAVRYSGSWSEKSYLRSKSELEAWMRVRGFKVAGDPVWARYNPPFVPWFLRRNEILIPVDAK